MIGDGRPFEPTFPEFIAFSKLINGIKEGSKITSIKFRLEGDEKEYEISQRLPMYLIEEALKEYSEDQKVEFDTEPVQTTVTRPDQRSFKIQKADRFMQPEERFMVRIVKSFYDYLLAEAPPAGDRDFMPSERYYALIASMLQDTWFLSSNAPRMVHHSKGKAVA
ncbi:MAG: hypothetical protein IPP99_00905 [Chitinophagaceae bacterium]|nr:hypothetical protein [Chitinophagaceae bacterium]